MKIENAINFLNKEAEDHLDNPEIIGIYDSIISMIKQKKNQLGWTCYRCEEIFWVDNSYKGDIYCPYCRKIVKKLEG